MAEPQRRDAVLGHPFEPELLDQTINPSGLRRPSRYASSTTETIACSARRRGSKKLGKQLPCRVRGDQQLDLPDAGLPRPRAIPVSIRRPCVGRDLAHLRADLGLHQLTRDHRDRGAHKSPCSPGSTPATTSAAVILRTSAIVVLLLIDLREQTDELGRHGGRNHHSAASHHLYRLTKDCRPWRRRVVVAGAAASGPRPRAAGSGLASPDRTMAAPSARAQAHAHAERGGPASRSPTRLATRSGVLPRCGGERASRRPGRGRNAQVRAGSTSSF